MTNQKTKATRCSVTCPCHLDRQWKGWDLSLGLPGFRAHGLAHCSVTSLPEHIARTGMGVMDSGMGASKLGLSWGVLTGSEWMWRRQSAGASEWHPYIRWGAEESLLWGKICMGRRPLFILDLPWSLVKCRTLVPACDNFYVFILYVLSSLTSQDQSSLRKGILSSWFNIRSPNALTAAGIL